MTTISKTTLQFLSDLKQNNNRDWFLENKPRFEEAKKEFEIFIDALILEIAKFDPSIGHHRAKDCIFRIYRDVRFSKDKSPYKTHFGAHVTAAAKGPKFIPELGITSILVLANRCWQEEHICRRVHGSRRSGRKLRITQMSLKPF
jgi:uncharacterized protein (TIGR02453 family)